MKKFRVLVLMHESLIPPQNVEADQVGRETDLWVTEYDVISTLQNLGHEVLTVGVYSDLIKIKEAIDYFSPHMVFNLLEEFDGEAVFDQNVVSYLELLRIPYTGCNPRGMILSREKSLTKKLLHYHRILTPKFYVFQRNEKIKMPKDLKYPLIVKCLQEEASLGISQASLVSGPDKLLERIQFIHEKIDDDALAEEFIQGREFTVGLLGNHKIKVLPVWEVIFGNTNSPDKEIYSKNAKYNESYRKRKNIHTKKADLDPETEDKIKKICKNAYKHLGINGCARIDLRMDKNKNIYIIEINPNPNLAVDDEFALSANYLGIDYPQLINKILNLSLDWHNH